MGFGGIPLGLALRRSVQDSRLPAEFVKPSAAHRSVHRERLIHHAPEQHHVIATLDLVAQLVERRGPRGRIRDAIRLVNDIDEFHGIVDNYKGCAALAAGSRS